MEKIDFKNYLEKKRATPEAKAPHQKGYWAGKTASMLNRPIKRIFGLTGGWSVQKMMDRYLECQHAENPARHWWALRKADPKPPPRPRKRKKLSTPRHLQASLFGDKIKT